MSFQEQMFKDIYVPNTEKYFPILERQLKNSSGPWFGPNLGWVDFVIGSIVDDESSAYPDLFSKYPALLQHSKNVLSLKEIQNYLKTRKV